MKTPLHKLLTNYIKLYGQVTPREVEQFCKDNQTRAYTGARRLQEVRQPGHRNYDPTIGTIEEGGTIKWYTFKPNRSQAETPKSEARPIQPERPRINDSVASQPMGWAYYPPEIDICCPIAKASDNRMHSQACQRSKAVA